MAKDALPSDSLSASPNSPHQPPASLSPRQKQALAALKSLQTDFAELRRTTSQSKVWLDHRATNADADGVPHHRCPWPDNEMVYCTNVNREGRQRFDEQGNAMFVDMPVLEVHGTPITGSAGQAFDYIMPAYRTIAVYGDESAASLHRATQRAGRAVIELRALIPQFPHDWSLDDNDVVEGGKGTWWNLVFEMAWSGDYAMLRANRQLPLMSTNYQVRTPWNLQSLRVIAQFPSQPKLPIPEQWLKRLPDAYVSEINDAAAASADAIDALIEWVDGAAQREVAAAVATNTPAIGVAALQSNAADPETKNSPKPPSDDGGNSDALSPANESPSRTKARAVYEWAISTIPGAKQMTNADLLEASRSKLEMLAAESDGKESDKFEELLKSLPSNAETFGKYLRDAGIKRYGKGGRPPMSGGSVRRSSQL